MFMPETRKKRKKKRSDRLWITGPIDYSLFFTVVLLNIYGVIMIYSASYYSASNSLHLSPQYFLLNQGKYVVLGLVIMVGLSFFNYHKWVQVGFLGIVGAAASILLLLTPLQRSELGAARWLRIGPFSFQASEIAKACMIVFYAWFVEKQGLNTPKKQLTVLGLAFLIMILIWLISNNLSTALIVFGICCVILLSSIERPKKYIITVVGLLAGAVLLCLLYVTLVPYSPEENFRITRIRAWMYPEEYASATGLQTMQSLYAIGAGGFWGKGLGQSLIKFKIPYPYNDFILSIICEELGVFGVALMLLLFCFMLYRIMKIALAARDIGGKVICIGVFAQIAIQLLLNIMVVIGMFPTTGVTLPFFSAGGSSAVLLLAELGIVFNVDKYWKDVRFRYEAQQYVQQREQRRKNAGSPGPRLLR